jgi:hypothetical protein
MELGAAEYVPAIKKTLAGIKEKADTGRVARLEELLDPRQRSSY